MSCSSSFQAGARSRQSVPSVQRFPRAILSPASGATRLYRSTGLWMRVKESRGSTGPELLQVLDSLWWGSLTRMKHIFWPRNSFFFMSGKDFFDSSPMRSLGISSVIQCSKRYMSVNGYKARKQGCGNVINSTTYSLRSRELAFTNIGAAAAAAGV